MTTEENQTTQPTLRDTIEQAVDSQEANTPDQVTTSEPETRVRSDDGRFSKKQTETENTQVVKESVQPVADAVIVKPRPSSWKKDYDEQWSRLDPSLQDYISQRESDYAKGVSTYKQNWDNAAPIYEAMQQFMPMLQQHNIPPQQWISNLGNAHKMLVQGSPEEKVRLFTQLATEYGVPIQSLTGQTQGIDPQFSQFAAKLNQIENKWQSFEEQRKQQELASLQNDITAFSEKAPYFEQVRDTMAGLLQSGVAVDLQSAYDKAIRLHDDIWSKQQEEAQQAKAKAAAEANQQKVAAAKAKAVSPRSISPTGVIGNGNGKSSLRDLLAEQFESQLAARV